MRKNNGSLLMIFLLVLVIVAASIFILRGSPSEKDTPAAKTTVTPAPPRESATPAPADPGETPAPAPSETPAPTPEPTPEPTPAPTPEPTPTPVPADAEGSFVSDSGTGLNVRVDWQTYAAGGQRKLKADVSIVSYSIFASAQYKGIVLKLGDETYSADCPAIQYDGKEQIVTPVATFTVDAPAPGTAVSVEWHYGGKYSGKELDVITARGIVQ